MIMKARTLTNEEAIDLKAANNLLLIMLKNMTDKEDRDPIDQFYIDSLVQALKLLPVSNELEISKYY